MSQREPLEGRFLALETDKPQISYIWGRTYETDECPEMISWWKFEQFCEMVSNKDDIFYETNNQVLLSTIK